MITLVALLSPDEEHGRHIHRNLGEPPQVRPDAGHVHGPNTPSLVPLLLPVRERDDRVVAAISRDVGGGAARESLARMDKWRFDECGPGLARGALE